MRRWPEAVLAIEPKPKESIAKFFNIGVVLTITLILSPFSDWMAVHSPAWTVFRESGAPERGESRARADQQHAGDAVGPIGVARLAREIRRPARRGAVAQEHEKLYDDGGGAEDRDLQEDGAVRIDKLRQQSGEKHDGLGIGR